MRKLILMLVVLCVATTFAFAGGGKESGGTEAEKVTITYGNWQFQEATRGDVLRGFLEEFQSNNPNITIEELSVSYSSYNDQLATQFEAGAGPDVLFVQDMALIPWIDNGYLEPLNDYVSLEQYEQDLTEQQSMAIRDDDVYGLIYEGFPYNALIINTGLLDEAGVGIPETPDELLEVSNAVAEATGGFGLIHPTNCSNRGYIMQGGMIVVYGFGGRIVKDGSFAVNEPEFVEGVSYLKRIFDSSGTPKGTQFGQQRNAYLAGEAAMVLDGSYWPAIVQGENQEAFSNLEVVHTPFPDQSGPFETNWYALGANSDEAHLEAAGKVIDFLFQPAQANEWAEVSAIPGLKFTYDAVLEAHPWFEVYAEVSPQGITRPLPGYESETLQIRSMVADGLCEAALGEKTPQQAMDDLQQQLVSEFGQ